MTHGITLALLFVLGMGSQPRANDSLGLREAKAPEEQRLCMRTFSLPYRVEAGLGDVSIQVSFNDGLAWRHLTKVDVSVVGAYQMINFNAPADGLYRFRVRARQQDGLITYTPPARQIRIRVDSAPENWR